MMFLPGSCAPLLVGLGRCGVSHVEKRNARGRSRGRYRHNENCDLRKSSLARCKGGRSRTEKGYLTGKKAVQSISTSAPRASPVQPTVIRAGGASPPAARDARLIAGDFGPAVGLTVTLAAFADPQPPAVGTGPEFPGVDSLLGAE